MKKILILIVGIALYLHFYPQPELNDWYEGKKAEFLDTLAKATKARFKSSVDGLYDELKTEFEDFSPVEFQNLKTITSSVDQVTEFYEKNCTENIHSKFFHEGNAERVCYRLSKVIENI